MVKEAVNVGKQCCVEGCDYKAFCKGVCKAHYMQLWTHGKIIGQVVPHSKARGGITKDNPDEYRAWNLMKRRCTNKNSKEFQYYGGRGVKVCDRWKNSFANFLQDMGKKPKGCSLDRINVNGDYCPENCRWATERQQQRNRRDNRIEPCIYPLKGRYYVQVEQHGVVKRKSCVTMEEAILARNIFTEEFDKEWR